jgi:hypothetical protein
VKDSWTARSVFGVLVFAMMLAVGAHTAHAAGPGNVYLHVGAVDADDFGSLDTDDALDEFGLGVNYLGSGWDAHLELNLFHAEADVIDPTTGAEVKRELSQFGFGVRHYWGDKRMHPDLGAGFNWLKFKNAATSTGPLSDSTVGLWVDGGIDWDVGAGVRLGFQGRVTVSTGIGVESAKHGGGYHLGLRVGWGWGDE